MKINDYESRKILFLHAVWLKALKDWFHAAHHASNGPSFSGDHVNLFGKIYQEVDEQIDGAIEKMIGLTNDKRLACPIFLNESVLTILKNYNSPVLGSQEDLVNTALELELDYILFLEQASKELEGLETLTLGLDDQLAAAANQHETYVYLLQQRSDNQVFANKKKV